MIHVGLDTNALYMTRAGTARYVKGLVNGINRLNPRDVRIREFAWRVENMAYTQPARALKTVYREFVWGSVLLPFILRNDDVDVFHTTSGLPLRHFNSTRNMATLLDCAPLRLPFRFRRWHRIRAEARLRRMIKAERIICISRFTADEAVNLLGADPAKLEVIHPGNNFAPSCCDIIESKPPFALPDEFYLFVGSLEPGKNLLLLRDAYNLAERLGKILPPLVIIGARWDGVANEGPPPQGWIYAGWQPDSVLLYCYNRAVGLVFPSLYEGFGLPVVEAMSRCCPVICSRVASLPEIGGDAVMYTDMNPESYMQSMLLLVRDQNLRQDFIEKGIAESSRFLWSKCTAQTVEIYKSLGYG